MHGWGHGDRATNEAFAPIETYAERFDALLATGPRARLRHGRHLGRAPEPGRGRPTSTSNAAREALARHGMRVATYATWIDAVERRARVRAGASRSARR